MHGQVHLRAYVNKALLWITDIYVAQICGFVDLWDMVSRLRLLGPVPSPTSDPTTFFQVSQHFFFLEVCL
jgi:hypothetical protein